MAKDAMHTASQTSGAAGVPVLSIVVPAYKEDANLIQLHRELVRNLEPFWCSWELILVDDGSPIDLGANRIPPSERSQSQRHPAFSQFRSSVCPLGRSFRGAGCGGHHDGRRLAAPAVGRTGTAVGMAKREQVRPHRFAETRAALPGASASPPNFSTGFSHF